jgi:ATP-binding cassette, subfamily B (MDR/TAP), member 1
LAGAFVSYSNDASSSSASFSDKARTSTLYFVYLAIAQFFATYGATVGFIYTGEHITRKIREHYLEALLRQDQAYFENLGVGECTTRMTADSDRIQNGISEKVGLTITGMSTFIGAFVIGLALCWKLMLILTWSVFVSVFIMVVGSRLTRQHNRKFIEASAKGSTVVEESIRSIRNIVAMGAQKKIVDLYENYLKDASVWGRRLKLQSAATLGLAVGINYLNTMVTLWVGSVFLTDGEIPYTSLITIQLIIQSAVFALTGISGHMEAFMNAVAAAHKVFRTIDRVSPLDSMASHGQKPSSRSVAGLIEFRNIKHIYPSRPDKVVLSDLNLVLPAGKWTALVGPSGSGKSTVIDLLERFYEPTYGQIFLDGHELSSLNIRWLRQQIGLVGQHPTLFDGTISENIRHGLAGTAAESMSMEQQTDLVEKAAHVANAHDFIVNLDDGYQTRVGSRGLLLSGGQKQRIAIARAVISNPRILLLDEATSALDNESEEKVIDALQKAAVGRTVVMVAHRLSTVRNADKIIVLANGKIVEQGPHDELVKKKGAYFASLESQNVLSDGQEQSPNSENAEQDIPITIPEHTTVEEARGNKEVALEGPKETKYSAWELIKFAMRFNKKEQYIVMLGLFCCLVAGGEEPVHAILFAESTITLSLPISEYSILKSQVRLWSLLYLALALSQFLAFSGQGLAFAWSSERMLHQAKRETFQTILRQDVAFFDQPGNSAGSLTSFLSTETNNLAGLSGSTLGVLLVFSTTLVAAIIIACAFGWKLALVCMVTVPVLLVCGYFRLSLVGKFHQRAKKAHKSSASYASEAVSEIRTVASLTREQDVWQRYHRSLAAETKSNLKSALVVAAIYALSRSVTFLCMALGFWYGGVLVDKREYSPFQFFVVYTSVVFSARSAGMVFSFAQDIGKAKQAAHELHTLYDRKPAIDTWSAEGLCPTTQQTTGMVEFRNIFFRYPSRPEKPVLQNISFTIRPGEHVAFVGASGSGKSTIVSLLERFYDPIAGEILLDGKRILDININYYRSLFALVSQDITLYDGSVRHNLLLGVDDGSVMDEVIEQACKDANIYEFIISLR